MKVRFLRPDGTAVEADAAAGERLLDVAQRAGEPLEGTCNGLLACATCHVVVAAEDVAHLLPPGPDEEDLLDLVPSATRCSRLSCQIVLAERMDGLTVRASG